jgi:colanic acid/amylovoran biosynthesis glycosyltransferase
MRQIAIFRSELLPVSETFVLAQANSLQQYTPHFVGLRRVGRSLPLPDGAVILGSAGRYPAALKAKVYAGFPVAPFFHRRIARLGASVIHAHFAPDGALAVSLAEKLGIPLVVTLHGYDVTVRTDFHTRYGKLWRKGDRFICVSEFIRKKAIEAGFPPEKLVVHYIGIDRKRFAPADSDRAEGVVLFVGRLVEKKGCSYLLSAMQRVQNRRINARLVIIGDGPLRKSLEQYAQELKLNCSFLGAQSQDVVRKNLQSASVLCVPSVAARNGDSEGLPITILEALCMKVPVVASRHAGIPEAVVDGETGLLATERDEKELAEQILRFLTDEPFRNACTRRGSDWIATQFDLIKQTSLLEDIYTKVASAQ